MKRILLAGLLLSALWCAEGTAQAEAPVSPPLESYSARTSLLWPKMRRGSSGFAVRALQRLLTARGFRTTVDGHYGYGTETVVRQFQRAHGLTHDGVTGFQTWEALTPTLKRGASGAVVRALQTQLKAQGTPVGVDGVFGTSTRKAVKQFESGNNLTNDGVADDSVWCYLVGGHFDGE